MIAVLNYPAALLGFGIGLLLIVCGCLIIRSAIKQDHRNYQKRLDEKVRRSEKGGAL